MKVQIIDGVFPIMVAQSPNDKEILYRYVEYLLSSFGEQVQLHGLNRETAFCILYEFYLSFPANWLEADDEHFHHAIEKILDFIYGSSGN